MIKFFKEETKVIVILMVALLVAFIHIFTTNMPQLFPFDEQIKLFLFSVSVSVIAAVIFYVFQVYLPTVKVRKIAKVELSNLCNRFVSAFVDAFVSSATEKEIEKLNIKNLEDFLSDGVAKYISQHFALEFQANHSPKMSWANRLSLLGKEINERCDVIACKYSTHLTENILQALHGIRSNAFVEYIRILDNREFLEIMKKHQGRTFLPQNLLAHFFSLICQINNNFDLKIHFSPKSFESQKGLLGKARIENS